MTRKLLPLALASVVALVAASCAEPPAPEVEFGSGQRFVPFVADSLNNAGLDASVIANADGLPVIGYFGFVEQTEEGELPQTRPVTAPTLPGVLLTTASSDGIWTRGAMGLQEAIPNVDVPFNPGFDESVGELTARNVTGLQMVVDGSTLHAVWGSVHGLFYATGSTDPASTTQFSISQVTSTPPVGPSIAVVDGDPWVAFSTSTSAAATVELATPSGDRWQVDTIAEAAGCETCRTGVLAASGGPAVAYSDGGNGVLVATNDGENGWVSQQVGASGGQGLSGAVLADGIVLSYYDGGQVTVAAGPATGPFETSAAADVAPDSAAAEGAGTSIAVDDQGTRWIGWFDAATGVGFASGEGDQFTAVETGTDTENGSMPSVAVTPDGSNAYLAWYDTVNEDLLVGAYGELDGLAIAAPSPEPSGPPPSEGPSGGECTEEEDGLVAVTAQGIQFDTNCIRVLAGEPFQIEFTNDDPDQHNLSIYPSADDVSPESAILMEDFFPGPASVTYDVPALEVNEYYFQCDVHPTQMIGTVEAVEELGGGGGGGEGATGTTAATGSTG